VTLALDAMTDLREEAHEYSIRNVFPRLGETGSVEEIISLLEGLLDGQLKGRNLAS
jgi:isochorismate hydrolase